MIVIGGGATGAGIAFDAASRDGNLKVACIERGDFASETSSRSTKLIWAGIRYLATASASLLSKGLLSDPIGTMKDFVGEMKMVVNCHRERHYMTEKQRHLTNWVPIAIPFSEWHVSPPPFNHALFGFFPILAPFVLKFYDSMSGFTCPPSYVMGKRKSKEVFPQLSDRKINYCAVFYEAQHNDSRTNLAIAMSAAEYGADISNYVEMIDTIKNEKGVVVGIKALDRMSNREFDVYSKKVIFAGGPFTDSLRELEKDDSMKPAVSGASGTHLVLPGYYCPKNIGLLDYNTSDGRFLFFVPWENHTLVGTTDTKCAVETLPTPPENEVKWILDECGKYLSKDLRVRRSDVLSAWRGWRPLAADPHAPPGAPVSRDHIISENPETGVIFIAGGKWTTWREMAEEVVDRVVGENGPKSKTLDIKLFGGEGYSDNLSIQLIQKHGMSNDTAKMLAKTYGGRAWEVCELSETSNQVWPRFGVPLAPNYPYITAEVRYACKEYACTIEDVLSRRTRLAFLNKDAALSAIPIVAKIMTEELGWTEDVKAEQIAAATKYVQSYAGRIPDDQETTLRGTNYKNVEELFHAIDTDGSGFLDRTEVGELASTLGISLSDEDLDAAFDQMDENSNDRVDLREFEKWCK
jgi:glycerol-3-phosphate dehydrogenase